MRTGPRRSHRTAIGKDHYESGTWSPPGFGEDGRTNPRGRQHSASGRAVRSWGAARRVADDGDVPAPKSRMKLLSVWGRGAVERRIGFLPVAIPGYRAVLLDRGVAGSLTATTKDEVGRLVHWELPRWSDLVGSARIVLALDSGTPDGGAARVARVPSRRPTANEIIASREAKRSVG